MSLFPGHRAQVQRSEPGQPGAAALQFARHDVARILALGILAARGWRRASVSGKPTLEPYFDGLYSLYRLFIYDHIGDGLLSLYDRIGVLKGGNGGQSRNIQKPSRPWRGHGHVSRWWWRQLWTSHGRAGTTSLRLGSVWWGMGMGIMGMG